MVDVNKAVRYAIGAALDGNLTYDGSPVPVVDDAVNLQQNTTMYVVLSSQTAVETSSFAKFDHECTLQLDITHKSVYAASKDGVDDLAQQIFTILQPTPTTNGLVSQSGVHFTDLEKATDNYLSFVLNDIGPVVRRIITYRVLVHEN
jgi:hypothetical protein